MTDTPQPASAAPRWLASRFMPRSPAITAGLLVMPLAVAAGLLSDRSAGFAQFDLRPSFAVHDAAGDAQASMRTGRNLFAQLMR